MRGPAWLHGETPCCALLFRTHDHCLKRRLVVWLPEFPDRQENSESDREARRV